ncbi:uncharacterized protein [Cicer arietinum]|uniref:uncharacterized protein isoform X2 n=1 Tax=Cicer arietinum TaxID=3827 RepID=UPI00032A5110
MEGGNRAEAERWLYTANKLLSARDLHGARSFAIRARESDPTFDASELLLAVIDTLLAGESRINDHHRDWYGILQILRYTTNIDHIANQYRRLALLLDPNRNPFAFSGHAFSLVHDAWSVLSNTAKKALYDSDLRLLTSPPAPPQHQPPPQPVPQHQQYPPPNLTPKKNPRSKDAATEPTRQNRNPNESTESTRQTRTASAAETEGSISFWTLCPYCYVYYEYPKGYEECALRCQSCRRGFHAVVIRSPPLNEIDSSFCTWGFFPLGFSGDLKDVNGASSNWNPLCPLFPFPSKSSNKKKSWVYYDEEAAAAFIDISDPSDDDSDDGDWRHGSGSGKNKGVKRSRVSGKKYRKDSANASGSARREAGERPRRNATGAAGNGNGNENENSVGAVDAAASGVKLDSSKKAVPGSSRRRGAGNLGKLDLNVEFSNEVEEPSRGVRAREGNATGNAEDNIEGIGFFEGLDEFLSSLPILNVVGDDKS